MNEPYLPIACALHDEFEIAIMHRKILPLKWIDDNGKTHQFDVLPEDILVKEGAEYLLAKSLDTERELCIRLDKIVLLGS
jgi:transcriptional antiterminator Rof (Rho-off)